VGYYGCKEAYEVCYRLLGDLLDRKGYIVSWFLGGLLVRRNLVREMAIMWGYLRVIMGFLHIIGEYYRGFLRSYKSCYGVDRGVFGIIKSVITELLWS
jgi:hypothetical protein